MLSIENANLLFGMYQDDAIYMVCAKSLAEGDGYRIISLPGEPYETKYPIGFPLFLSLIWRCYGAFADNLLLFHLVMVLVAIAVATLNVLWLRRTKRLTTALALVIVLATLLNENYVEVAPMILSDFFCALLAVIGLWRTEKLRLAKFTWPKAVLLGLLWVAPALVRIQGLAVPLSAALYLLTRKQRKFAIVAFAVFVGTLLPVVMWQAHTAQLAHPYLAFYSGYLGNLSDLPVSAGRYIEHLVWNFQVNSTTQMLTLFPFLDHFINWSTRQGNIASTYVIMVLAGAVILLGGIRELIRRNFVAYYAMFYSLPAFFFPIQLEMRQFVPIIPFGYYFFYKGWRALARWSKRQIKHEGINPIVLGRYAAIACGLYLVIGTLITSLSLSSEYKFQRLSRSMGFSPQAKDSSFDGAFQWVKENTQANDSFIVNCDPLFYLYTGRKAVQPWRIDAFSTARANPLPPDPLEVFKYAHPKYIVDDPMYRGLGKRPSAVAALVGALYYGFPGSIKQVFESKDKLLHIYEVDEARLLSKPASSIAR